MTLKRQMIIGIKRILISWTKWWLSCPDLETIRFYDVVIQWFCTVNKNHKCSEKCLLWIESPFILIEFTFLPELDNVNSNLSHPILLSEKWPTKFMFNPLDMDYSVWSGTIGIIPDTGSDHLIPFLNLDRIKCNYWTSYCNNRRICLLSVFYVIVSSKFRKMLCISTVIGSLKT